jgi:putative transposase
MPWKEPMSEKMRLVLDAAKEDRTISDICRQLGISRPTAYKWLGRFKADGLRGLAERSRAPKKTSHALSEDIIAQIVHFKTAHSSWGPKKIAAYLKRADPSTQWPVASTIGDLLKRRGLVKRRRVSRRTPLSPFLVEGERNPNDVWGADYKGWFRTGDGRRVDPLTVTDLASRYLLRCEAVTRTDFLSTKRGFEAAFKEFGLPLAIRSDNGAPFASVGLAGLSKLSVWWMKLGIKPDRIRPSHPEENGKHERMHRTLKEATAAPPKSNLAAQERAFQDFVDEYNRLRPHEALGMKTPDECYRPSPRPFPLRIQEPEYGTRHRVMTVRANGAVYWKGRDLHITQALAGEMVGMVEVADGEWRIEFAGFPLALYAGRDKKVRPIESIEV